MPSSILLAALAFVPQGAGGDASAERPLARVERTEVPPVIDGRLDDAAWERAMPIGPLIQVEPREGATPSERTEVRLLFDEGHLYVGIRCFDSDPGAIIATQRERDAVLDPDDRIEIVFDTFHDRRNAYFFQINPAGSKGDALINDNGNVFNKPWDGIWHGKATLDELGWAAEIALPFETLSFDPQARTWGLNVNRHLKRRREVARWAGASQDLGIFTISEAGDMVGLEGIHQGVGLDLVPFAVSDWTRDSVAGDQDLMGDAGLDAFYRVTPNLTASLTVNTDFAETEVDERQINLTRFPLFFPERRDFFLEDSGVFQFADLGSSLVPFFSRRVGLVAGREVPILAGLKLTGRAADYNVGVLDVQTDDQGSLAGQNLFAARVSRNVGEQSTVGGIVTHGNPDGTVDNSVYGVDANYRTTSFRGNKRFQTGAWILRSDTEGVSGDDIAFGGSVSYPNDVWSWFAGVSEIRRNFDPALGFVSREDRRDYSASVTYSPRVDEHIRNLEFQGDVGVITDTAGNLETVAFGAQPLGISWESGDELRVEVEHTHEELLEDFQITDTVVIPRGDYDFGRVRLVADTALKRPFSLEVEAGTGGFFDGHRTRLATEGSWRPSAFFTGGAGYERNDVSLPGGDFTTRLARLKLDLAFTPDLGWNNFLQWDSESDSFGLNSRMRWIPVPGRELFLVFNQTLDARGDSLNTRFQGFSVKLSYTFRF